MAGFALSVAGIERPPLLGEVADIGVKLLLFSVGLKLDVRFLLRRGVWRPALAHMAVIIAIRVGFLAVLGLRLSSNIRCGPAMSIPTFRCVCP